VRGVVDADYNATLSTGVYRPSGTLQELYPDNASLLNVIGPDNTATGFDQALPLTDWTSLSLPLQFHAVYVKDDRHGPESGEPIAWQPRILLVPKSLEIRALQIVNATLVPATSGGTAFGGNPREAHSPFLPPLISIKSAPATGIWVILPGNSSGRKSGRCRCSGKAPRMVMVLTATSLPGSRCATSAASMLSIIALCSK